MPLIFDLAVKRVRRSANFLSWTPNRSHPIELNPKVSAIDKSTARFEEPHYTPQELAETWGVSAETIRVLFRNEPGVLKIGPDGTRFRRGYKSLRIPQSVAERVHTRLSA
jgi:hypothetical protein